MNGPASLPIQSQPGGAGPETAPGPEAVATDLEGTVKLAQPDYNLKHHILSPLETLAQSVSAIAPSASPTLTVPLVFALAGQGTWLAYLIATICIGLVAICIASFARDSASPGSLYVYTRNSLPPAMASLAAWALFFAYVTTASSVAAGFINYAYELLGEFGKHIPPVLLAAVAVGSAVWLAQRDIKMSTRIMLWIEGASVCLISFVIALVLWKYGFHFDSAQFHLRGASATGIRLGVVLALFSFVGFESATALGSEAREPLKTIPQAVIRSALLAGIFFLVCAYGEVLGFRGGATSLGENTAPLQFLATRAGVTVVGRIIDVGVLVSMFASTLACTIAAARVLMLMAHHGLTHRLFARTHATRKTPVPAGLLTGFVTFVPVAALAWRGVGAADIYGWMGTLSVYGFITIYGLIAIALPIHLKRQRRLTAGGLLLAVLTTAAMAFAMAGNIYPWPPAPILYFPYIYLAYIAAGLVWYYLSPRRPAGATA